MTGHLASWTIRSMMAKAWLVPSLTMTRATSGRSIAVRRATSVSDDFALALNHENPEIDTLVVENERFATIEKSFGEAARIARATNPRR